MVCLGITFRCKHSTSISYLLTGLVIIAILVGLKIFCYAIYRVLYGRDPGDYGSRDEVEMHTPPPQGYQPPQSYMINKASMEESKLVILTGDDQQVSSVAQPQPAALCSK